jgi:hypothetical protein
MFTDVSNNGIRWRSVISFSYGLFIPRNTTVILDKWLVGPRADPNIVAIKCLIIKENSCLQLTNSNLNHFKTVGDVGLQITVSRSE